MRALKMGFRVFYLAKTQHSKAAQVLTALGMEPRLVRGPGEATLMSACGAKRTKAQPRTKSAIGLAIYCMLGSQ
jgi:hypothetical protein